MEGDSYLITSGAQCAMRACPFSPFGAPCGAEVVSR